MPYIKPDDRKKFNILLIVLRKLSFLTAGDINYLFSKIIDEQLGEEPNYARYNEIIGALECCKLELYRRQIAPYEKFKKTVNGDVYKNREYWKRIKE